MRDQAYNFSTQESKSACNIISLVLHTDTPELNNERIKDQKLVLPCIGTSLLQAQNLILYTYIHSMGGQDMHKFTVEGSKHVIRTAVHCYFTLIFM